MPLVRRGLAVPQPRSWYVPCTCSIPRSRLRSRSRSGGDEWPRPCITPTETLTSPRLAAPPLASRSIASSTAALRRISRRRAGRAAAPSSSQLPAPSMLDRASAAAGVRVRVCRLAFCVAPFPSLSSVSYIPRRRLDLVQTSARTLLFPTRAPKAFSWPWQRRRRPSLPPSSRLSTLSTHSTRSAPSPHSPQHAPLPGSVAGGSSGQPVHTPCPKRPSAAPLPAFFPSSLRQTGVRPLLASDRRRCMWLAARCPPPSSSPVHWPGRTGEVPTSALAAASSALCTGQDAAICPQRPPPRVLHASVSRVACGTMHSLDPVQLAGEQVPAASSHGNAHMSHKNAGSLPLPIHTDPCREPPTSSSGSARPETAGPFHRSSGWRADPLSARRVLHAALTMTGAAV